MPPPAAPADCRRCGVCCFSSSPEYLRIDGEDWARLGAEAGQYAHFIGNRAYMRLLDGHCAALLVRRDPGGQVDFFCGIYDRRPGVCRALDRGSPHCLGELSTKADRVTTRFPHHDGAGIPVV